MNAHLCLSLPPGEPDVLEADVRTAAQAGFRCIALPAPRLEAYMSAYPLAWLDAQLVAHGVYVGAVYDLDPLLSSPPAAASGPSNEDRLAAAAQFLTLCASVDRLGGGTLVVPAGPRPDPVSADLAAAHALSSLSDLAAPFEVQIALEAPCSASGAKWRLEDALAVLVRVQRPNVGLCLRAQAAADTGDTLLSQGPTGAQRVKIVDLGTLPCTESRSRALQATLAWLVSEGYSGAFVVNAGTGRQLGDHAAKARAAAQALLSACHM